MGCVPVVVGRASDVSTRRDLGQGLDSDAVVEAGSRQGIVSTTSCPKYTPQAVHNQCGQGIVPKTAFAYSIYQAVPMCSPVELL